MLLALTDYERISRSIDELRRSLSGWDWNGFASTLLATIVGACAAAAVSFVVLKQERDERYRDRLAGALRPLLREMIQYSEIAALTPNQYSPKWEDQPFELGQTAIRVQAEFSPVLAEARPSEREVLRAATTAAHLATQLPRLGFRSIAMAAVTGTLTRWRANELTRADALETLRSLPGAAIDEEVVAQFGWDIPDEDAPEGHGRHRPRRAYAHRADPASRRR